MAQVWAVIAAIPQLVKLIEGLVNSFRIFRIQQRRKMIQERKDARAKLTEQLTNAKTDAERESLLAQLVELDDVRR